MDREAISSMRKSYGEVGLEKSDENPIKQFILWLAEAAANPMIVEANAMVLSTVNNGEPSSRTVLLKDVSEAGFTFFTNYESKKATDLSSNPNVALLFPWYPMERQVKIIGRAEKVSSADSDAYFATRPWSSQIGAWASNQSQPLSAREDLETIYKEFAEKYPEGSSVPRPPHWGGYLVTPTLIEFWQGRYSRLHDRIRYTKAINAAETNWKIQRVFP
jgi:pyridoxamine 5'-phosphate oxidase